MERSPVSLRLLHHTLTVQTQQNFEILDLTPQIQAWITKEKINQGQIVIVGQHTTTALVLNENEERLWHDIQTFFEKLVPANVPYLHNDLHLRDVPEDEPINAHSHLIAMLLSPSLSLPIVDGRLGLGTYQSILMVELDGSRSRQVVCQVVGG
jgi:secondary thiamine-phosphate synthase enzyme